MEYYYNSVMVRRMNLILQVHQRYKRPFDELRTNKMLPGSKDEQKA